MPRVSDEMPLSLLGCSSRTCNVLEAHGIMTVSDLRQFTRQELLCLTQIGVGTVREIEERLAGSDGSRAEDAFRRRRDPTAEEIRQMCADIRSGWTEDQHRYRAGISKGHAEVPFAHGSSITAAHAEHAAADRPRRF